MEEQRNIAAGNPGDVDFIGMVRQWRADRASDAQPHRDHASSSSPAQQQQQRIRICVRKRPVSDKERQRNDHDSVTCLNPTVWIHCAKRKVDGITKYLDHTSFTFDHAFDENVSTDQVYKYTTMPLLDFCLAGIGGRATVFAFGQTGSGKTHTMQGIQEILAEDLFLSLQADDGGCSAEDTVVMVSFFEMYGGSIQDLLNDRARLKILEDGRGEINVTGLTEAEAASPAALLRILRAGNVARTTHATDANDASSRSHALCQIALRDRGTDRLRGKLSLVDLAGSERGMDTKAHTAQRRGESAEINTSLLALKECIRALDSKSSGGGNGGSKGEKHVPYRSSKLTLILKDCFTSDCAMTTMIATVRYGCCGCFVVLSLHDGPKHVCSLFPSSLSLSHRSPRVRPPRIIRSTRCATPTAPKSTERRRKSLPLGFCRPCAALPLPETLPHPARQPSHCWQRQQRALLVRRR